MSKVTEYVSPDARWAKWLQFIIIVLLVPWMSWLSLSSISLQRRVAVIESNRFTSADALSLYQELSKKANRADVPPTEVRNSLSRLEDGQDRLLTLIEGHLQWHMDRD